MITRAREVYNYHYYKNEPLEAWKLDLIAFQKTNAKLSTTWIFKDKSGLKVDSCGEWKVVYKQQLHKDNIKL